MEGRRIGLQEGLAQLRFRRPDFLRGIGSQTSHVRQEEHYQERPAHRAIL